MESKVHDATTAGCRIAEPCGSEFGCAVKNQVDCENFSELAVLAEVVNFSETAAIRQIDTHEPVGRAGGIDYPPDFRGGSARRSRAKNCHATLERGGCLFGTQRARRGNDYSIHSHLH